MRDLRQILKYPGSKWNIAKQLTELMPQHHSYVEPFFGSGALLFTKQPSDIETVNDLDHDVVNLFLCIQENPEKLARLCMTTPYSRYETDIPHETFMIYKGGEPYCRGIVFSIDDLK